MKKLSALLLTIAILFLLAPAALAASDEANEAAETLNELGLFNGVGENADGTPNFDLDRAPTRHEAVTMLVRLLGKESEAKSGTWETPFSDVADWAKPYVGYAYANKLTNGVGDDGKGGQLFGGSMTTTATQYLTFVLRALGYESGTDFQWNKAWELTDQLGITAGEYNETSNFIRGNVAQVSENALSAKGKNLTTTLLDALVKDGAVTKAAADTYRSHPVKVKSVTISEASFALKIGDKKQLIATVMPQNATDTNITWESSDSSVASVSSSGLITALKKGTATISAASANGKKATCAVTVSEIEVTGITLNKTSVSIKVGESASLTATVAPTNANDKSVTWSSSDSSVATVSNGTVRGVKAGSATIMARSASGVSSSCTIKVNDTVWYNESMYRVGSDLPEGAYYAVTTIAGYGGYYCLYSDSSQKKITQNNNFDSFDFFYARSGQYLKLSRCKIAPVSEFPTSIATPINGVYGVGSYRVGIDIPAGEYKFTITSEAISYNISGYYCAYTDITKSKIEENDLFDSVSYYTVKNGQLLLVNRATFTLISETPSQSSSSGSNSGNISTGGSAGTYTTADSATGKTVSDLVSYISTRGTIVSGDIGSYRQITETRTSNGFSVKSTITYRDDINKLLFISNITKGSNRFHTQFDYDLASQTASSQILVDYLGSGIGQYYSNHADFNIASYTDSTVLAFTSNGSSFSEEPADFADTCNMVVRLAVPCWGMLTANKAGVTLADIGFSSY